MASSELFPSDVHACVETGKWARFRPGSLGSIGPSLLDESVMLNPTDTINALSGLMEAIQRSPLGVVAFVAVAAFALVAYALYKLASPRL